METLVTRRTYDGNFIYEDGLDESYLFTFLNDKFIRDSHYNDNDYEYYIENDHYNNHYKANEENNRYHYNDALKRMAYTNRRLISLPLNLNIFDDRTIKYINDFKYHYCKDVRYREPMVPKKKINYKQLYLLSPRYDKVSIQGNLGFTKSELGLYEYIKRCAIRTVFQPIVLLSNPNSCSMHFKIKFRDSFILPEYTSDIKIMPVDIVFDHKKYSWWHDLHRTKENYCYATTLLAYLIEKLFLRKLDATLRDTKGFVPYIKSNFRTRDLINDKKDYAYSGNLENISLTNIGLFNNIYTGLLYYASMFSSDISDKYPLQIYPYNNLIHVKGFYKRKCYIDFDEIKEVLMYVFHTSDLDQNIKISFQRIVQRLPKVALA